MTVSTWRLRTRCGYRTPVVFLLRLLIPTAASVAVAVLLSGHHVVLTLGAAALVYGVISMLVGPIRFSDVKSFRQKQSVA